jgi:hypothetical protein
MSQATKDKKENAKRIIKDCGLTASTLDLWLRDHEVSEEHIKMMTAFDIGNYALFRRHEQKKEHHKEHLSDIIKLLKPATTQPRHYIEKLIATLCDHNADTPADIKIWHAKKVATFREELARLGMLKTREPQTFTGTMTGAPPQPKPAATKAEIAKALLPPEMEAAAAEEEDEDEEEEEEEKTTATTTTAEEEEDEDEEDEEEEKAEEKAEEKPRCPPNAEPPAEASFIKHGDGGHRWASLPDGTFFIKDATGMIIHKGKATNLSRAISTAKQRITLLNKKDTQ